MCSENLTTAPRFGLHSGLGACFPAEIAEAHIDSAKLLCGWAASYSGSLPAGLPTLAVDQIFEVLHGQQRKWRLSGPSQAVAPLNGGNFLGTSDNHRHTTRLDSYSRAPYKKLAKYVSFSNYRPSKDLINTLPDELLCQIFHFLGTARDRVACASVSKRWLMLQSHMPRESFMGEEDGVMHVDTGKNVQGQGGCAESDDDNDDEKSVERKSHLGDLSRCLSGRKASDVRLAAIALGTGSRGGLGKLCIRGGSVAGLEVSLTDVGLSAIGSWCSGLRVLSLWNCPFIQDEGLAAIAKGCRLLERVDLFKCPLLGDMGLQAIARSCSQLSFLNLDECGQIGDNSLVTIAEHCPLVTTLNIQNCPRVSDRGIIAAVCSLKRLKKMKLAGLRITDKSLVAIGSQARELLWLSLHNLDLVSVDGFVFFGMAANMQSLKRLLISLCKNFTDVALGMLGKHCGTLKHFSLSNCEQVTDKGLAVFMKSASHLQVLELERCNLITGTGLVAALSGSGDKLRELQVKKCEGIQKVQALSPPNYPRGSALASICLADCLGVGDLFLALVGLSCPEATTLDLSGLTEITDDGLLAFLCGSRKLTSVKLSGCVKVTDRAVCAIAHQCGQSVRNLVLDGCKNVSDRTLKAISSHCAFLEDLDVSECSISNEGLKLLVDATGQTLSSLNLSGCLDITDRILPLMHKKCDSLLDLNLKNCSGLSERAICGFQSRMWNCTVLY